MKDENILFSGGESTSPLAKYKFEFQWTSLKNAITSSMVDCYFIKKM